MKREGDHRSDSRFSKALRSDGAPDASAAASAASSSSTSATSPAAPRTLDTFFSMKGGGAGKGSSRGGGGGGKGKGSKAGDSIHPKGGANKGTCDGKGPGKNGSGSGSGSSGSNGRVAITGVAGFLGQLARQECEAMGFTVVGFDLPNPKCQGGPGLHGSQVASAGKKADFEIDLGKADSVTLSEKFSGCSHVIHLAADGRPSADFVKDVMPNNILATFNVLEAAKLAAVPRVIFASSNHVQHGETMGGASGMDWERLEAMGGPANVTLGTPLSVAGPDSYYGISKLTGEALGSYFARVQKAFEFVALRIGWCLYDSAEKLNGTSNEDYLKAMYLSHRDFRGFLHGSMVADIAGEPFNKFVVAYAVSNNSNRLFDLDESIRILGYTPQDGYKGPVNVKRPTNHIDIEDDTPPPAPAAPTPTTSAPLAAPAALTPTTSTPAAVGGGGGAAAAGPSHPNGAATPAAGEEPNWEELAKMAEDLRGTYKDGFAFPPWSIEMLRNGQLLCGATVVYYREGDSLEEVKAIAAQREPCNIMMRRPYSLDRLERLLGHRTGGYSMSTKEKLQPNIAIFCRTPIRSNPGPQAQIETVNVINVIGYAFDAPNQPDWQYFLPLAEGDAKWKELVARFSQMWRFIFECAERRGYKRIYLADVGGGAFSEGLNKHGPGYLKLKDASLNPIKEEYKDRFLVEQLPRIPDFAFQSDNKAILEESLLVNAWDPWSMVGNGNFKDNSLDGFFGRCTAMAVLCWPKTNPCMKWEAVKSDW